MEKYPCPYCNQNGFETIYNHDTDEKENMDCTGCWGDLWVSKGCYDNYFIETGKTAPNNKYTAPQASPKFCPRCPYQMLPSGDGYVCTKCGYCE